MPEAPDKTRLDPVVGTIEPVYGVAGYVRRLADFDSAATSFDRQKLAFADHRKILVDQYVRDSKRGRDVLILGAFILAMAAAARVSGEDLSPLAWSFATLAPSVMFCAKSWQTSAHLKFVDAEALYVADELAVVNARRLWLARAVRLVPVLERALDVFTPDGDECADAIGKVVTADRKLTERLKARRYAATDLADGGWGLLTDGLRRALTAGIAAGAINSLAFAAIGRPAVAITCGAATSVFAAIRYAISSAYTQQRADVVTHLALWNKQVNLFADLDKVIRNRAEFLISLYREKVVVDLR